MKLFFHSHAQLIAKLCEIGVPDSPEEEDLVEAIQAALRLIQEDLSGTISDFSTPAPEMYSGNFLAFNGLESVLVTLRCSVNLIGHSILEP